MPYLVKIFYFLHKQMLKYNVRICAYICYSTMLVSVYDNNMYRLYSSVLQSIKALRAVNVYLRNSLLRWYFRSCIIKFDQKQVKFSILNYLKLKKSYFKIPCSNFPKYLNRKFSNFLKFLLNIQNIVEPSNTWLRGSIVLLLRPFYLEFTVVKEKKYLGKTNMNKGGFCGWTTKRGEGGNTP